jgi:hypothetical protein
MIKRFLVLGFLYLTACGTLPTPGPTPNDFPPPPPMTPIEEWPQVTPTATLEPRMRPILLEDLDNAKTLFLIIKTSMAAGDDTKVAELVKYPIRVKLDGQEIVLSNQEEFLDQYPKIFDQKFITALADIDESNLILLPNGVQVGNGALWLNYFCTDLSCSDAQFLITQINK